MIISNVFFYVLFLQDGAHGSLYESKEQGIKRRQNKEIRSSRNKPQSNKTDTRALKSTFWSATVTTKTHTHTHTQTHTNTDARTHAHAHAHARTLGHTHTRTHTHTHTITLKDKLLCTLFLQP